MGKITAIHAFNIRARNRDYESKGINKGDQSKMLSVIEKYEKSPPHLPSEILRKKLMVFRVYFRKFSEFSGIFYDL